MKVRTTFSWSPKHEMQRIWCETCERNGRYFWHWNRGHRIRDRA